MGNKAFTGKTRSLASRFLHVWGKPLHLSFKPQNIEKTSKKWHKSSNSGFTLIELMIVIAIIGILASASVMSYMSARDKARIAACKMTVESIKKGMELYAEENSSYPPDGTISTFEDIRTALGSNVDFSGRTSCDDVVTYTSTKYTYTLEFIIRYSGGATGGVKLILSNGALDEQPI